MKKLLLVLIAFLAVFTYIRAFTGSDIPADVHEIEIQMPLEIQQ